MLQAFILAGGLGSRLRSVIDDCPKAMAPVKGKPFLEHQLEFLKAYGIRDVVLCIGYMGQVIKGYFGSGERWGIRIEYSEEKELLGTAGALKNAEAFAGGTFLVMNGDTMVKFDLQRLLDFHRSRNALATVAVSQDVISSESGNVLVGPDGRIKVFAEKTEIAHCDGCTGGAGADVRGTSMGIYAFEPGVLSLIPRGRKVSLETEVFPEMAEKRLGLWGHLNSEEFVDIGTPERYAMLRGDDVRD